MAKEYYTPQEAQEKLATDEPGIKDLVRQGKLREFRQDGKLHYKAQDVDTLAAGGDTLGLSATGEIVLEPADGSTAAGLTAFTDAMDLTAGGDLLSLADDEAASKPSGDVKDVKKDDTVFTSVGVSVFEGDELELEADSGAQTVPSEPDSSGSNAQDASGSGSGLLDMARVSDDTSLGAELLDEIYPDEGGSGIGEATAAGVAQELGGQDSGIDTGMGTGIPTPAGSGAGTGAGTGSLSSASALGASAFGEADGTRGGAPLVDAALEEAVAVTPAPAPQLEAAQAFYIDDPYAGAFTGVMLVTVPILGLAGAVCAAFLRDAWPAYLDWISNNIMLFGGASLGLMVVVLGVGLFMGRPSTPSAAAKARKEKAAKKPKKPKVKKDKKAKKK